MLYVLVLYYYFLKLYTTVYTGTVLLLVEVVYCMFFWYCIGTCNGVYLYVIRELVHAKML
jgi:hypothetical protein